MSENRLHPFSKKHVPFLKKGCMLFQGGIIRKLYFCYIRIKYFENLFYV